MAKSESAATGLKSVYSFEHLVVGPNNNVAVAACQEVIKAPGETYNPIFIYGPSGVGKTHLIQATANEILQKHKTFKARYLSAERFTSDVVTAIAEDRVLEVRKMYGSLDLLILDDVQYLAESKVAQEELFHIFNNLHQEGKQVILAADRPPNQLGSLNKNIRSRLEWGLSTDVKIPDEATRALILKRKQESMSLKLSEEMVGFVARSLRSNVRELEGFLKRIHAYSTLSKQELNMSLVKSVVKEILPEGHPEEAHPEPPVFDTPPPKVIKNGNAAKTDPAPPPKEAVPFDLLLESIQVNDEVPEKEAPPPPAAAKPAPPPEKIMPAKEPPPPPRAPEPPKMETPAPEPVQADVLIPEPVASEGEATDELPSGHKEVGAVFFYPQGAKEALESVHQKFQDVIKKHKLKFRLKRVYDHAYTIKGKVDYSSFVEVCKNNKVPVAIVIGPPPEAMIPQQDFYDLLTVTLDVQGVSLQLVNWSEVNKDYRYLNLALDIALVRSR